MNPGAKICQSVQMRWERHGRKSSRILWLLTAPWWSLSVISKCFMTYAFISGFPDVCHLQDHVWSLIPCLTKETWNMGQKSSVLNALFFKYSVLSPVWKKKKKKCSIFIACLLATNHYYLESDFIYCELVRDDWWFFSTQSHCELYCSLDTVMTTHYGSTFNSVLF